MTTTYSTTVPLGSKEVRAALYQRATRLEARITELALGAEGVRWPEGTAKATAKFYARKLAAKDVETAHEILRVLVDETEAQDVQFWGTELGRALFLLGAFREPEMSRATAQALLGVRSRQRLHQLVTEESLYETMGGTISADSVRALMVPA